MITTLRIKNYRSFAELDIQLERLTVLVGPNGSGKSNLVDVVRFVRDALQYGLDAAVVKRGGMGAIRRWSAKGRPFDVELTLGFDESQGSYGFVLGSARRGEYQIKSEECRLFMAGQEWEFVIQNGQWITALPAELRQPALTQPTALALPLLTGFTPFNQLYEALTQMSFYTIMPNLLREPQKPANPYPLEEDARNLASVLRELQTEHRAASQNLTCAFRNMLGDIEGYQVQQVGGYLVTKLHHLGVDDESRAPLFELFQESDGTLRLLGILTALYQEPARPLVALEEPELTIHPGALSLLWEEIQAASGRSQMLITTHSPDLLDMCTAEQLRVVEKVNGITHIGPISETQKRIIKKKLFAPGQLLREQGLTRTEESINAKE